MTTARSDSASPRAGAIGPVSTLRHPDQDETTPPRAVPATPPYCCARAGSTLPGPGGFPVCVSTRLPGQRGRTHVWRLAVCGKTGCGATGHAPITAAVLLGALGPGRDAPRRRAEPGPARSPPRRRPSRPRPRNRPRPPGQGRHQGAGHLNPQAAVDYDGLVPPGPARRHHHASLRRGSGTLGARVVTVGGRVRAPWCVPRSWALWGGARPSFPVVVGSCLPPRWPVGLSLVRSVAALVGEQSSGASVSGLCVQRRPCVGGWPDKRWTAARARARPTGRGNRPPHGHPTSAFAVAAPLTAGSDHVGLTAPRKGANVRTTIDVTGAAARPRRRTRSEAPDGPLICAARVPAAPGSHTTA